MSFPEEACNTLNNPIGTQGAKYVTVEPKPQHDALLEKTLLKTHSSVALTKRETEILDMIIDGLTNRRIAQKLHRTERTVEYHRNHLMHKFEAKTAADLVKRAILSR
jgi:DNA-binding NarL/FixJ family response regulator